MKKPPAKKHSGDPEDDMLQEYRFDYRKAKPNRFAASAKPRGREVLLDPDVAKVFTTAESVNAVLRALITTMPKRSSG
jgi:hypothetical protein